LNVVAAEMEASIIFVLARAWDLRAGGIAVVLDNVLKVTGDDGHFDPEAEFAHTEENVARLCRMRCEVVRILSEQGD
jgi:uridine phosphorylase